MNTDYIILTIGALVVLFTGCLWKGYKKFNSKSEEIDGSFNSLMREINKIKTVSFDDTFPDPPRTRHQGVGLNDSWEDYVRSTYTYPLTPANSLAQIVNTRQRLIDDDYENKEEEVKPKKEVIINYVASRRVLDVDSDI